MATLRILWHEWLCMCPMFGKITWDTIKCLKFLKKKKGKERLLLLLWIHFYLCFHYMLYVSKLVIISKLAIISLPCLSHTTNKQLWLGSTSKYFFLSALSRLLFLYLRFGAVLTGCWKWHKNNWKVDVPWGEFLKQNIVNKSKREKNS